MRITCPNCRAAYNVDERRLPAAGLNVRCPKCQNAFPVRPPAAADAPGAAVPLPTVSPPPPAPPPPPGPPVPAGPPVASADEGMGGFTARFASPFEAGPAAPPPEPVDTTMRFERPFDVGPQAPPVPPTVPLPAPRPSAAPPPPPPPPPPAAPAPVAPALSFGEVDLPGEAAAFDPHEPLPVPPDLPPPGDPFGAPATGGPAAAAAEPADVPPPASPPTPAGGVSPFAAAASIGPQAAEELEALFDEGTAANRTPPPPPRPATGGGASWSIRRRSGKVFGPFPEAEVVQMLSRGELLGNEEVSRDATSWQPIGEVGVFGQAIRTLIDRPDEGVAARPAPKVGPPVAQEPPAAVTVGPVRPGPLERLAALRARMPAWTRWLLPGAAVALVLGVGLSAGLGDYGIFFHRLIRGQVGPNRPGARLCKEARAKLAEDTWPAARAAVDLTRQAVALSSVDREAKGLFAEAVAFMGRRAGAPPELLAQAQAWVAELQQKSPREPGTERARLALSLLPGGGQASEAAAELEKLAARTPPDEEAAVLLAEAALARPDGARAEALYLKVDQLHPTARSAHGRGLAAALRGDGKSARARFEEALARDPGHLSSAVELAALAAAAGDAAEADRRAGQALDAGDALGPRERARARQIRGELLARQLGDDPNARLGQAEKELEAAVKEDASWLPARVALSRFLLRRGQPDRALAAIQPAVAAGGPEAVDLQARALAATGRVLDAVTALDAAIARGQSPRLTYAKGWVLEQGGKAAEAEKLYAEAATDAAYWEPHLALGRLKLRGGDLAGAAPEIQLAVDRAPGEPDAQAGLGALRLARNDLDGAAEAWKKALALDPSHAQSHLGLARVALARKEPAAAIESLERAVRFDPRLADAQLLLGTLRWQARDLPGAASALEAAVAVAPANALARTRLGAVQLEQGQVEAAATSLLAASNVDVALPENRFWLGRTLLAKGDAGQAIEQLAKAVELDNASGQNHLWLGVALEKGSKLAEAGDAYRAALDRDPRLVEAAERLALLDMMLGRHGEAVPLLEKAIQLSPRDQRLRMELADCRMKLNQAPQAIQIYKDALKADPSLKALYYRIARAVHDSQGEAAAVPWYERAVKEDRDNPMPYYYLGFHAKLKGKKAQAVEAFRTYLRLKPDAEDRKDIELEIEDLGG